MPKRPRRLRSATSSQGTNSSKRFALRQKACGVFPAGLCYLNRNQDRCFLLRHRDVILSEASRPLGTRSRRTPRAAILPILFAPFLLQAFGPGRSCSKKSQQYGLDKILGVLRLRTSQKARGASLRMTNLWGIESLKARLIVVSPIGRAFSSHMASPLRAWFCANGVLVIATW
jgi:hypothetical protein